MGARQDVWTGVDEEFRHFGPLLLEGDVRISSGNARVGDETAKEAQRRRMSLRIIVGIWIGRGRGRGGGRGRHKYECRLNNRQECESR